MAGDVLQRQRRSGPPRPVIQQRTSPDSLRSSNMAIIESIRTRLSDALKEGDAEAAEAIALEALQANCDPLEVISDVMIPSLTEVGNQFQSGEVFLPELMMAGDAAEKVSK